MRDLRWPDSRESIRRRSRESPDSRESFQGCRTEPLFCESGFGGLKIANRGFEAIRANRSNVMKIGIFLRGSIRANRPGSRCDSRGHLSVRQRSVQERKFSPKRKFLAGYPCGHPAKNFGQALQILGKQAFWERTLVDIHEKLRSEKLRADFPFPILFQIWADVGICRRCPFRYC